MRHFKNIIIGFGKAGKTLAGSLTSHGEEVLLIEKDPMMYGGTCINIACLPTKNLVINSQRGVKYEEAFETKEAMKQIKTWQLCLMQVLNLLMIR